MRSGIAVCVLCLSMVASPVFAEQSMAGGGAGGGAGAGYGGGVSYGGSWGGSGDCAYSYGGSWNSGWSTGGSYGPGFMPAAFDRWVRVIFDVQVHTLGQGGQWQQAPYLTAESFCLEGVQTTVHGAASGATSDGSGTTMNASDSPDVELSLVLVPSTVGPENKREISLAGSGTIKGRSPQQFEIPLQIKAVLAQNTPTVVASGQTAQGSVAYAVTATATLERGPGMPCLQPGPSGMYAAGGVSCGGNFGGNFSGGGTGSEGSGGGCGGGYGGVSYFGGGTSP